MTMAEPGRPDRKPAVADLGHPGNIGRQTLHRDSTLQLRS
jgi:hypothetical protein